MLRPLWFVLNKPSSLPGPHCLPPSLPQDAPQLLISLRDNLLQLPYLDPSSIVVSRPIAPPSAPPLPQRLPQGKRGRGGTCPGESVYDDGATSLWSWILLAQVKEGTENKGSIESAVRAVRKSLLLREPPVILPPNSKRRLHNGWAMVDAGDCAIHILSAEARQRYFGHWA